jgi:hypothetical protein
MEDGRLLKQAFLASLELAEQQRSAARPPPTRHLSWAAQMTAFFSSIDVVWRDGAGELVTIDDALVVSRMQQRHLASFPTVPTVQPKSFYYVDVIRAGDISLQGYALQPYLRDFASFTSRKSLAQFRTGSHWLRLEKGRFLPHHIPRAQRVCLSCVESVEDEHHMLFACPVYEALRSSFASLFPTAGGEDDNRSVHAFLQQQPTSRLAHFIGCCAKRHAEVFGVNGTEGGAGDGVGGVGEGVGPEDGGNQAAAWADR